MKVTYMVEDKLLNVAGYYRRLTDAKESIKRLGNGYITKLYGTDFGEGYHIYYLSYRDEKFSYVNSKEEVLVKAFKKTLNLLCGRK